MDSKDTRVGRRVRQVDTGALGTIVGRVFEARTAGNALMVRVAWDSPWQTGEGKHEFLRRLALDEEE